MPVPKLLNLHPDHIFENSFSISLLQDGQELPVSFCRSDYHRIFLFKQAAGRLLIDEQAYTLSGQELFLAAKGQVYAFRRNTRLEGYELCFGDCFWEKAPQSANNCKAILFNNAAANQHIPLQEEEFGALEVLFQGLYQESLLAVYPNKPDAMAAYLKILMIKIANINSSLVKDPEAADKQLYWKFLELVSEHYQSTHDVAEYASRLGITSRKLTELCKLHNGSGAKNVINGQLIAESKRALQFSALSVKEIAFRLNFATPEQFSHFFKKETALSPLDYREHFANIGR
ncbi:AraC family transcriptional regulator [Pedobacter nutrimenti]|uniref:AraC-like DNA-binding protein n=1 Tax=Pedobacter nutrimenti TaxID=1241337 RepID=A0A318UF80_9SPHI|nr:AraC family transcriptional regulator [Pedobacter nutrimenti]PYF74140.1 AraC-like DNA-binding protein [Pedobacter nutrimenti]